MEWGTIFKVSGDNLFNNTETVIILFSLFTIGIKKNQNKNFVMTGKNQKSSSNVLPLINHVSSFKNIQKSKIK